MLDRTPQDAFRWPPAPSVAGAAIVPRPSGGGAAGSGGRILGWRDHVLDIERTWLGLERPSWADMIREAGWRRDAAASYCGRCGRTAGGEETLDPCDAPAGEAGCRSCRGRTLAWDRVVRLGEHDGLLRDTVLEVKFSRARGLGHEVGRALGVAIAECIERVRVAMPEIVVVPMPPSRWRRFVRGIDHASVVATGVASELGVGVERWLRRAHRPAQSTLSEASRRRNVAGAMQPTRFGRRRLMDGSAARLVLVVDDVMTTGSTMEEACRRLAGVRAGAGEVWACVATAAGPS